MSNFRIQILSFATLLLVVSCCFAQQKITSIVTSNSSPSPVSYSNVKGSGIRSANNSLAANWDSTGTNFTVTFNSTANSLTSITQFNVYGHTSPFIMQPAPATVKIRRSGNSYVNNTRNHYNFWAVYSSVPANNATTGTFSLSAPEITAPETAFLSNNINSGYDNIFQNTINNLHAGNIERIDFILPSGLKPNTQYDIDNAGPVVFDRGTGDDFKIALITSLDANKDPLTYGPLISVRASDFGSNLLTNPANYCILVHDPNYGNISRPSTKQNQNIRGVIMTLGDLGLPLGRAFYGYSLFATDVSTASTDWNTYPNNTDASSQLDPVNVLGVFRDVNIVLPVAMQFDLTKQNDQPLLQFTAYNVTASETVIIERSSNGRDFSEIGRMHISSSGKYSFKDEDPLPGLSWYRLRSQKQDGSYEYSETKTILLPEETNIRVNSSPGSNALTIQLSSGWQNQNISAFLYNASGTLIGKQSFIGSATTKKFPVDRVKPGIYFLQLTNVQTRQTVTKQVPVL